MRAIRGFRTEIIMFVSIILIQLLYLKISIVFSEMHLIEMLYLITMELMIFILYVVYKKWLYAHQLEKSTHYLVQNHIEELKTSNKELLRKNKTLESINEEVYDIIYGYIHDLKTPVAAIRLSDPTETIKKEVFRLEEIIEKLLYLSRITDIRNDLILNNYSMKLLVKNVVKKYKTFFIEKKISLTLELEDYEIITDQKWIEFAISQIISNALKYTDALGEIIITADKTIQKKHLIIIDNGCGIPEGYIHRIFEKGFSFDQKNRYYKGTGIGLYLAKKIFDYLGIRCNIESTFNQGTRFTLYINESVDIYNLTEL